MPLPMPRSVISSPIHMITPVPAVMVRTMIRMVDQASFGMMLWQCRRRTAGRVAGDRDQGRDCRTREPDGQVARVLGQLGVAGLALLVERLEVRDDDRSSCTMMLAVM